MTPLRRPPPEPPVTWVDRLGSAALGLLAGLPAGALAWVVWLKLHHTAPPIARFVFGGAGAGCVLGFLSLDLGFEFVAGVIALLAGFFVAGGLGRGASRLDGWDASFRRETTPRWRRVLAAGCFVAGILLFVLLAIRG